MKPNKLLESLDNKKVLLIIIVLFIILYLDFSFVLQPQLGSDNSVNKKISKVNKDIANLKKELSSMQDLKRKQQELGQSALGKAKKIISNDGIPGLLNEISAIANKNKIRVMQIKPSKEIVRVAKDAKGKEKESKKFFGELITLDLACGYHSLGSFINDLENNPTFLTISELKLTENEKDYMSQQVKLVLKTYVKE